MCFRLRGILINLSWNNQRSIHFQDIHIKVVGYEQIRQINPSVLEKRSTQNTFEDNLQGKCIFRIGELSVISAVSCCCQLHDPPVLHVTKHVSITSHSLVFSDTLSIEGHGFHQPSLLKACVLLLVLQKSPGQGVWLCAHMSASFVLAIYCMYRGKRVCADGLTTWPVRSSPSFFVILVSRFLSIYVCL